MNKTKYLQTDGRWGGLVYPKKPCYIRNVGCGEVGIANMIIEMEQYKNYTPATIQPWCKQFGAPNCDGTYFSGIPKMMTHYGMTEVKEHATMDSLWKELAKGDRVAIYLMGSRKGGSKGVHWTSGGHFVVSVDYKYENGKHYVYMKDSYSNSSLRNGWISYEENMRNDVVRVWSGKLSGEKAKETTTPKSNKLAVDGIGGTNTIKATQKYFGVSQDGYLGDQLERLRGYYPSITAVEFGKGKSGSQTVKALQKWLGLTKDGVIGQGTTAAWQKRLRDLGYLAKNETIDGIFGVKSMKAWQKFLNDHMNEDGGDTPSPTEPPKKSVYRVIDVSDHQRQIDWNKVKADDIVGAIIRYADGDTLDVRFRENMVNAKKAGLHIGAYIFSRAKTKAEAEKEATRLFNAVRDYAVDMPLYIDLEAKGLEKYANTVAQAFIAKIKALGGKPGVYASLNWWNNYLVPTAKLSFAMWLAQYYDKMEYKPASYVGMWQYTSSGKVNGISGNVDRDELYIPYWETAPTLPRKTVDELAHEVIDGLWGKNDARKKDLTDAGYDYYAVQNRVNEILTPTVPDIVKKELEACKVQADWMKNAKYEYEKSPTVAKSKNKGTCVTYVSCVLQRLGLIPSGQSLWHDENDKVYGANGNFTVIYPKNKTLSQLKNELKAGDIVMDGSGVGSGSHIFILTGEWKGSKPVIWDNWSGQKSKGAYTYDRDRHVIAIVRPK